MNNRRLKEELKKEIKNIFAGNCPACGLKANMDELRDVSSRLEFDISGLCQRCQDETFLKQMS